MTDSTRSLTPDTPADLAPVPGVGVPAEAVPGPARSVAAVLPFPGTNATTSPTIASAVARASRPDYPTWLAHTAGAGGCTHPVRLTGTVTTVDTSSGEVLSHLDTRELPDAVLYTACGNRRAAVCPSCAELYRADTYQLVRAGIVGNPDKNIPATISQHPCLFVTLTAPSFGPVHGRRTRPHPVTGEDGPGRPCRPSRKPTPCPHGRDLRCRRVHTEDDPALGKPLCLDCYDHDHHAVWNGYASELWRRTTINIRRQLDRKARALAGPGTRVRLSYAKVGEFQTRGAVHFHALIRLDGHDPDDPDAFLPPPAGLGIVQLEDAVRTATSRSSYRTDPHPDRLEGWPIVWGSQVDIRTIAAPGTRTISDQAVAGYLAKYATKATETTGHLSQRITPATVDIHATPRTHTGRLIAACWRLGKPHGSTFEELDEWKAGYGRLRRWAHMLGFPGHFTTKSRRYSTTYGVERARRQTWRRRHAHAGPTTPGPHLVVDEETTLIVGTLTYAGTGWRTTGDALLATTAAAQARERQRAARDATAHLSAVPSFASA